MEARHNMRRVPIQPILVALTIFFTLVLGLFAGYAVARIDARVHVAQPSQIAAPASTLGPDAQSRNEELLMQQQSKETTHGH